MKTILITAVIFILTFSVATSLTPEQERAIDKVIEETIIPLSHITGLGLTIVKDGVTLLSKGYGKKDIENDLDLDENTLFTLGSMTKGFTAIVVVKTLVEKFPELGEAALDTPIVKLAPNYNFTLSDRYRAESLTFRDLLTHRTCLENNEFFLLLSSIPTRSELLYRARYIPEICPFRNGYVYDNLMYTLAGDAIAHIAQSGIEKMLLDLMGQIGMSGSWIIKSNGDYEYLPNMPKTYIRKQNQTVVFNNKLLGRGALSVAAGGLISSTVDIAKYLNFQLSKGRVGDKQIIPEEAMNWLTKPSNTINYSPDVLFGEYAYALGLVLSIYDRRWQIIQHTGLFVPFHSYMSLIPSQNLGIFSSSNGPGVLYPPIDHRFLHAFIFDLLNGIHNGSDFSLQRRFPGTDDFRMLKIPKTSKKFIVRNNKAIELESVVGLYGHPAYGNIIIDLNSNGTTLQFSYGAWGLGHLQSIPGSETEFQIVWETDLEDSDYADGQPIPTYSVDFGQIDTVFFKIQGGAWFYDLSVAFERDATLDRFPSIPWSPDSCAPDQM